MNKLRKHKETSSEFSVFEESVIDLPAEVEESLLPLLSVVIPTYNSSQSIGVTLQSIFSQDYRRIEILIVDGGSKDRTIEVINSFRDERIRIVAVPYHQNFVMFNQGISLSQGEYINFLLPGDFYLYPEAVKQIMVQAWETDFPDLIYCGCLLRDTDGESQVKLLDLNLQLLRRGRLPTSLESCWYKTQTIKQLGKFSTEYTLRGSFDLLCRFCKINRFRSHKVPLVLTDFDVKALPHKKILRHFMETYKIIYSHFGPISAIKWLFSQNNFFKIMRICLSFLKAMLWKK